MSLEKLKKMLSQKETRKTFFQRIAKLFSTSDPAYALIENAYDVAKDALRGKFRDDRKTRAFEHTRFVAIIVLDYLKICDEKIIAAALLHDVPEDSRYWTVQRIRKNFGKKVARIVDWLGKPSEFESDEERDLVYHQRLQNAPRCVFKIKISDRLHNILTLRCCTKNKRIKKIAETRKYYLPWAEKKMILFHELEAALEEIERSSENVV